MNTEKYAKTFILLSPILLPLIFHFLIERFMENTLSTGIVAGIITLVLFSILFKRTYCSYFCIAGAAQRGLAFLRSKVFKKRFIVSKSLDKPLRSFKYIFIGAMVIYFVISGELLSQTTFSPVYSPFEQYRMLMPALDWAAKLLVIISILGTLVIDNFFCKYLCLHGALYGISGRFSPSSIVRYKDKCINCSLCSKNCRQNLEIHTREKIVAMDCLGCHACIAACPRKDAMKIKFASFEIPHIIYVAAAFIIFASLSFITAKFLY